MSSIGSILGKQNKTVAKLGWETMSSTTAREGNAGS